MIDEETRRLKKRALQILFQEKAACVLVVDAVELYTNPDHPSVQALGRADAARHHARILQPIQHFVDAVRGEAEPIWVAHATEACGNNSDEVLYSVDEAQALNSFHGVTPRPSDLKIAKTQFSAFAHTGLHEILKARQIGTVIVTGFMTSECITDTVIEGNGLGYNMIVPEDLIADWHLDRRDPETIERHTRPLKKRADVFQSQKILDLVI